ncbi:MAG: response regulator transcription factor [Acidimicrobiia bacterium]|nr:response regulator transcription factor [Acidimicrobiia bacterium]
MTPKTRLLLADDHALVRRGLRLILSQEPTFDVVGEASDGREVVTMVRTLRPDVVLMDVAMPRANGVTAVRSILEEEPNCRILMLSMHSDAAYVRESLRAGAKGYLLKDAVDQELVTAIKALASGNAYLSPAVSNMVLADYRQHVSDASGLTTREREVMQLLAEGLTAKEIAKRLEISAYTVDAHRTRIMRKLQISSIGELVRFAMRAGLIS